MKIRSSLLLLFLVLFSSQSFSQWYTVASGGALSYKSISFYQSWGFAAGDIGLLKKSVDHGTTWTTLSLGASTTINDVYTMSPNIAFLCGVNGMIYKTTNGGTNWTAQTTAGAFSYYDMDFINQNTGMVVGDDGKVGFTTNGGTNWIQAQLNVTPGAKLDYKVCDMIDQNTWVVASADTQISNTNYSYIHRTTNNGTSYQNLYTMSAGLLFDVSFKYIRVMSASAIYAATANGNIVKSTNNGVNWSAIQLTFVPLSFDFANIFTGYSCGQGGDIRKTTNGGVNWVQQTSSTTSGLVSIFCRDTNTVFAAGLNGTIVRTQNGGGIVGLNLSSGETPSQYSLSQNYPNPFNPSTKISFDLPHQGFTRLTIYNVVGKEVKVLLSGNIAAGKYETEFDASELPSGTYFYRLETGEFIETRKMILIK